MSDMIEDMIGNDEDVREDMNMMLEIMGIVNIDNRRCFDWMLNDPR